MVLGGYERPAGPELRRRSRGAAGVAREVRDLPSPAHDPAGPQPPWAADRSQGARPGALVGATVRIRTPTAAEAVRMAAGG